MQFVRPGESDRDHQRSGRPEAVPKKIVGSPDLGPSVVPSRFNHGELEAVKPRSAGVEYTPPGVIPGESGLLGDRVRTLLSEQSLADPK